MVLDDDELLECGLKGPREDVSDDQSSLNFKHMKTIQLGNVLWTIEDSMVPKGELSELVLQNPWSGERPSDLYTEIWEEIWIKTCWQFCEHHWSWGEQKPLKTQEVGDRGELDRPEEGLILLEDPHDTTLDPRFDISVIGSKNYVPDGKAKEELVEWVDLLGGGDFE